MTDDSEDTYVPNDIEMAAMRAFVADHDDPINTPQTLEEALSDILNRFSAENDSGTPDFILAGFLAGVLKSYNETIRLRAEWRGESIDLFTE